MMTSRSLRLLLTLSLILISQAFLTLPAHATASPACDPQFRKSLQYRGWQEAQREIMVNETYIKKPDSVFSLSCFGSALSAVPAIFSQAANTTAANTNTNTYMGANFNHGYLTNGNPPSSGTQSTSSCGQMNSVWNTAKCVNLGATVFDGMKIGDEPRSGMSCGAAAWGTASGHLNNVGAMPLTDGTTFDTVKLFLNVTDPLSMLTSGANCSAGIPTGVKIGAGGATTYDEIVCGNPGCVPFLQSGAMKCCDQTSSPTSPTKCQ